MLYFSVEKYFLNKIRNNTTAYVNIHFNHLKVNTSYLKEKMHSKSEGKIKLLLYFILKVYNLHHNAAVFKLI